MVNYISRYIADYATITEPLRALTKKNSRFVWNTAHQEAFDNLKEALKHAPVVSYFDVKKDTVLTVDASPVCILAIQARRAAVQRIHNV